MRVLAIARGNLVRFLRDRSNLFSALAVPLLVVLLLGAQFGGDPDARIGVAGPDPLAAAVVDRLDRGEVEVTRYDDGPAARRAVDAGDVDLAVVLPADAGAVVAAGDRLEAETVASATGPGALLEPLVLGALAEEALAPSLVARLAEATGGPGGPAGDRAEIEAAVEAAAGSVARTEVGVTTAAGDSLARAGGRFASGAAQQLTLFVFLMTLLSAITMVQSRQLGVIHRILVAPVSTRTVVLGEAAGRWAIATAQGAYILVATVVLFGVGWGNLVAAGAVVLAFGAVGAAAGMLLGAVLDDENLVTGVGLLVGLSAAAVGGAMLPAELLPSALATVSRAMPHWWAVEALGTVRRGGGLADVAGELAVLAGGAVAVFLVAAWCLRVRLTR